MKMSVKVVLLGLTAWVGTALVEPVQAQSQTAPAPESTSTVESLIEFAERHLHIPYRSGGASRKGFDCSGFVRYIFSNWGFSLPHSSAAQADKGEEIDIAEARPGDLIFFKGSNSRSTRVGHVGIITEVTPDYVRFIHSAFKGGIRYDLLQSQYYRNRFLAIRRILTQDDEG